MPRGPEGAQRALIVLLAVAQEADVVPQAIEAGVDLEDLFEERLGLIVATRAEVEHSELEEHRQIAGPLLARPLEGFGGGGEALEGDVHQPRVIQRVDVAGVETERFVQVGEGILVAFLFVGDDGLGHEHVGLGSLGMEPFGQRREEHRKRQQGEQERSRTA